MAFENYRESLTAAIAQMEQSGRFKVQHRVKAPAYLEDMNDTERMIAGEEGMDGFTIPAAMKEFYRHVNGFELSWQYTGDGDPQRVTAGLANVAMIDAIVDPEGREAEPKSLLYEEYRLFDDVGEENQVYMRFQRGRAEPELYYFVQETGKYHRLSLDFARYLELLLQVRAMAPWQEFFVDDKTFTPDRAALERFMEDLRTVFPDADPSAFQLPG